MILARGITKTYRIGPVEINAVDSLDVSIAAGEFLSIVGPSGSGKTTLLHLIGLLDTPTSGSISIDGMEAGDLSAKELTRLRREKIGFVFQEFNLLPVLRARENVELPLRYLKVPAPERYHRAMEALEKVGLGERANNRPGQLSGGEQQRVAIARALVTNPVLVLADEPTGELDTYNTCKVIELMRDLNRETGQTFAIVTHDPMVADYTRRIITLRDGKIASDSAGPEVEMRCDDIR
ncbi:MAG: ABC transporter ATP-binding protein [Actinomycetota bacterium]|nr:ABC transporter ATP-binding protein [Actinomycetota bacterium]MDD5668125.1 ABC transporter ATP-binding protein [Actinomycetota bacterium]